MSEALIHRFYAAVAAGEVEAVLDCLHPSLSFSDPVFPDLRGAAAYAMWRELLSRRAVLGVRYDIAFADERKAQVRWETTVRVGRRQVVTRGHSTFALWDERIVRQVDEWDFFGWCRRARGLRGWLLGSLPPYRRRWRRRAHAALDGLPARVA